MSLCVVYKEDSNSVQKIASMRVITGLGLPKQQDSLHLQSRVAYASAYIPTAIHMNKGSSYVFGRTAGDIECKS
jgi:hypothetical protein